MSARDSFTTDEWSAVTQLPGVALMLVLSTGDTGVLQGLKEMRAGGKAIAGAKTSSDALIAEVVASVEKDQPTTDGLDDAQAVPGIALALATAAMAHVRAKAPESADTYRDWILHIAENTAAAAKEKSIKGGASNVTPEERAAIQALTEALA